LLRRSLSRTLSYLALVLYSFVSLAPFVWMLATTFKSQRELFTTVALWPEVFDLSNWQRAFDFGVVSWLGNSFFVAATTTVLSIIIGVLAGYAIARLRFRGRNALGFATIIVYLVPSYVLYIAYFAFLVRLNMIDNLVGLAITHLSFTVPYCTWLCVGYFKTIPPDLEDAALVDGCSRLGSVWRIVIPLAMPAVVITATFSFTLSWNEFLYSVLFVTASDKLTIAGGLMRLMTEDVWPWGLLMTGSVLTAIVPVTLYFLSQRWIVRGLTLGGVKG